MLSIRCKTLLSHAEFSGDDLSCLFEVVKGQVETLKEIAEAIILKNCDPVVILK